MKNLKLRKFKTDTVFFHNEKITVGYTEHTKIIDLI